jgi:putative transposase
MQNQLRIERPAKLYAFIEAHRDQFDVRMMCQTLGVSRSSFYEWRQNPVSNRARENERLLRLIRASFKASHGVYGARRVFLDLREAGETCSKHRVARLMRINNIRALYGYRKPRYIHTSEAVLVPNILKRDFAVSKANSVWVTDITYVRTWEGWLYLAVVMDLFSRKIVGWATKPTLARELALDAVLMAVRRRRPKKTVIHSDQGSQYGSDAWRRFCRAHRLQPSMSRRGNCWDNAVAESFFGSLKKERIKKRIYKNREIATADISAYIEQFYNTVRRHSYLAGVSPDAFEAASRSAKTCPA